MPPGDETQVGSTGLQGSDAGTGDDSTAQERLEFANELLRLILETISHDLRGPLSLIQGAAEVLGGHVSGGEPRRLVRTIAHAARRATRLVDDLMGLHNVALENFESRKEETDLAEVAARVVADLDAATRHTLELELRPARCRADVVAVERIIENLLQNAMRHTEPGTRVWLRVYPDENGDVLLVVADDGPGVPDERKEVVFEPFERGPDSPSSGVGLGLSLVRRFAEAHGGRTWVADRPGGGAAFHVWLPHGGAAS